MTTTSLGFRSKYSLDVPYREIEAQKAKKIKRFEINRRAIAILQDSNSYDVCHSRFFTYQAGGPKLDARFQRVFEECFVFMRGREGLVREGAYKIICSFDKTQVDRLSEYRYVSPGFSYDKSCYSDVYNPVSTWDNSLYPMRALFSSDSSYLVLIRPTKEFRERLEAVVDENCGLFRDFLMLLKQENRGIERWAEVDGRLDYQEQSFSAVFKGLLFGLTLGAPLLLYNKFGDELREIYSRLLAIKWLEQDQQRLAGELGKRDIPKSVPIFLPEYYFCFEETRYVTYPTLGDGACALQALLGEKIDGEYRYRGNVRKAFTDALREQRHDPHIQQLFLNLLKSHLDNVGKDPSSKMLFSNLTDTWPYEYIILKRDSSKRLDALNLQEADLWMKELEGEAFKEKFLEIRRNDRLRGGKAPETPEQVLEELRQDSTSILSTICGDEDQLIPLLGGSAQRQLFYLRHNKTLLANREAQEGDKILLSDKAFNHYVHVVEQETFWFNTQEIELASHLFNKKTLLFSVVQEGEKRCLASQIFNPDIDGETTHIFHRPGHFCRVAPSDETTQLDLILSYSKAQHAAQVQIQIDTAAQELLKSTAKQEVCHLGFAGGASFFTACPLFIGAQAVKSATSLTLTYLDPYRDSQISRGTEALALPVFQLATGGVFKTIAVSFLVDQSMRQLCRWDKEKTGVETPEWAQRMVIVPITTIADAVVNGSDVKERAVKFISGVFGATIKGGMDEALHKLEERCGIDEAYWINDPSWGWCVIKAGLTNDAPQEIASRLSTKWVLKGVTYKSKADEPIDEVDVEEPVINPEVARQIEINAQELAHAKEDLIQHEAGVVEAQKKVSEKFTNYQEASKKSKPKDIDNAKDSLDAAHDNLNNFTRERDAQKKVVDALKAKDAELRSRLYSPVEERDFLNRVSCEEDYNARLQAAYADLIEKEAGVTSAAKYLEDKTMEYNNNYHQDKYYSKLKQAIKNYNNALTERDAATNKIYELQGSDTRVNTPHEKIPERASTWEKTKLWIDRNVEIHIGMDFSAPLYSMPKPTESTYHETQMDLAYEGCSTDTVLGPAGPDSVTWNNPQPSQQDTPFMPTTPQSPTINSTWTWETYQAYTDYQLMQTVETNIHERPFQPTSHQPLDLTDPRQNPQWQAHLQKWEVMRDMQDLTGYDTGFVDPTPFAFARVKANEVMGNVKDWGILTAQKWEADPNQATKDLALSLPRGGAQLLGDLLKTGGVQVIADLVETILHTSTTEPTIDKVVRVFDNWYVGVAKIDPDSPFSDIGIVVGQFCVPLGGAKAASLTGRATLPSGKAIRGMESVVARSRAILREQAAFLERMNRPAYRSGIVGEKTVARLAERNIARIEPKTIQVGKGINRSNNHQFVTWIENGQIKTASIGDMSYAGTFHDRGGLTKAGRALQKHSERVNPAFPKPTGTPQEINLHGQKMLDEILNHPNKQIVLDEAARSKELVIDIFIPNGHGARFSRDGKKMIGFLEPLK